jgi:predicted nucleic acid-binding protein
VRIAGKDIKADKSICSRQSLDRRLKKIIEHYKVNGLTRMALTLWQVTILPITTAISERASRLVEEHFLAHHLQLADALIAATAIEHKLPIVTSNTKHFQAVKTLKIEAFKPL